MVLDNLNIKHNMLLKVFNFLYINFSLELFLWKLGRYYTFDFSSRFLQRSCTIIEKWHKQRGNSQSGEFKLITNVSSCIPDVICSWPAPYLPGQPLEHFIYNEGREVKQAVVSLFISFTPIEYFIFILFYFLHFSFFLR